MNQAILEVVQACSWSPVRFLVISDNVFAPLIYYSHLGSLVVALFFGCFVFFRNKKALVNKLLFYMTIALSIWLFSDLVLWATNIPVQTMFFWSLEIIFEPIIYILSLYFLYVFIDGKEISIKIKSVLYSLLLPTLVLAPTKLALIGFDLTNCDRAATEGWLPKYGYLIEIGIIFWIVFLAFNRYFKTQDLNIKKQIIFTATGIFLFLFSFSLGNITEVFTENWYIGQIGYIGIPIFIGLLAYSIVRFKAFNIKLIGAQALVVALWIALFTMLFIRHIENVRIVVSLTLILFLLIGIALVRSVKREVQQREQIEKMAEQLKKSYETEKKAKEDIDRAYALEKKAKEELEKLDKFKDQFLMTTQHNLRTPLTSMMGYSDLLLKGNFGKLNKKVAEVIGKFQSLTQGMIRMVNDFLNMAQFQLGKSVVTLTPGVDLATMLEELIGELKFKADSRGISLNFEKPESGKIFAVSADREKLKAAMFNIIDNAVKYTVKGGVTVKISNNQFPISNQTKNSKSAFGSPSGSSEIQNSPKSVLILVQDTGIGITAEKITTLFESMFERSEEAKKVSAVGTGVGLYLSAQIIKAHNGKVWAESKGKDQGSIFYVELPIN